MFSICNPTQEEIAREIRLAYERGKPHAIVVVAEGARYNAEALANYFKPHAARLGFTVRATVLGYVQRGGAPTYADRMLATRLGVAAVEEIAAVTPDHARRAAAAALACSTVSTVPLT